MGFPHRSLTYVHTPLTCCYFPWVSIMISQLALAMVASMSSHSVYHPQPTDESCLALGAVSHCLKHLQSPAFLSALLMAYLTVYPTSARVYGKPSPRCDKVLGYISPTIVSHWPSKYLCTNFLTGAFKWSKVKTQFRPNNSSQTALQNSSG